MLDVKYIEIKKRALFDATHYIIINDIKDETSRYVRENGRDKVELTNTEVIQEILKQQLFELKNYFRM